jgi:hypothetical protein
MTCAPCIRAGNCDWELGGLAVDATGFINRGLTPAARRLPEGKAERKTLAVGMIRVDGPAKRFGEH